MATAAAGCGNSGLDGWDTGAAASTGRRSFDVTVTATITASAASGSPAPSTPTCKLTTSTLVVDATAGWLLLGGNGQGVAAPIRRNAGTLAISAPLTFDVWRHPSCQESMRLQFETLNLTIDGEGKVRGRGAGKAETLSGDVVYSYDFTAALDGVPDTTAPALGGTSGVLDPLKPARFPISEPLPAGATARLMAADGSVVELKAEVQDGGPGFVTAFQVPSVLPFGGSYRFVLDSMGDFAGNRASPVQGPPLTTPAAPALFTDGGFEMTPTGMLGGGRVFAAGDLPALSGTKSLYVYPYPTLFGPVIFRLAVQPGDKVVRFSYRATSMYSGGFYFWGTVAIGSPGSPVASLTHLPFGEPHTMLPSAVGGTSTLGPLSTAELPLPDPGAREVVLEIFGTEVGGGESQTGLIIDDLRVER